MNAAVFFDLDGTLSDPKIGIVRSIRYALNRLELDCPGNDELTWCIGPPLLDSFRSIVGHSLAPKALDLYRERFSEIGWKENDLYPGIIDLLRQLAEFDRPLYVATSKPYVFADRIIRYFELEPYFSRVFGSELDGTRSNKADLLRFALSETRTTGRAVMVGDRKHDVLGAKANKMRSIGVTYGYGSQAELETAGADAVVDCPEALHLALT
jgi:phosphoglycolate phosphatase